MKWYCIRVKTGQERRAEDHLIRQGYEVFFPYIRRDKRVKSKSTDEYEPAFPGYGMVSLVEGESNFAAIGATRGVIGLVKMNRGDDGYLYPTPFPNGFVENLMQRTIQRKTDWAVGDKIRVKSGPFEGFEAEISSLETRNGEQRVFVLLEILGRQKRVRIDDMEPL